MSTNNLKASGSPRSEPHSGPRSQRWLLALAACGGLFVLAAPVWAGAPAKKQTAEQHRKAAAKLAIKFKVAQRDSQVSTVPSLTAKNPGTQGTKCFIADEGPPRKLTEIDCNIIVIVEKDD